MSAQQLTLYFLLPAVAYFLGSIPFAFAIGKARGVDIRTVGSRNVGATNLGRTLGMRYFFYAFLLDAAKGFVPVLIAALLIRHWNSLLFPVPPAWQPLPAWPPLLTGGACVVGHLYPIWLKFKGGKGVATGFGVVLGFWPLFTLGAIAALLFFVVVFMIYRYISLASMTASLLFVAVVAGLSSWEPRPRWMPIETFLPWPQRWPMILVAGVFSLLIIIRHRGNIVRLLKGTEPRFGIDHKTPPPPPPPTAPPTTPPAPPTTPPAAP